MLSGCAKIRGKIVCTAIATIVIIFTLYSTPSTDHHHPARIETDLCNIEESNSVPLWEQTLNFEELNVDNTTGTSSGCYLIPNYIHYIYFGGKPINYVQLICILAAFKNQNPEKIFFHHNNKQAFTGKYWKILEETPGFKDIVVFDSVELPSEIFGQPLNDDWKKWHGSDIMRIQVLMKYGGIYLDTDCYLVQNIDHFRKYEMVLNWDEGQFLGSQVLIAHKDARFLKKYLNCYKFYDKEKWYYNAGEKPTIEILYKEPELIHRVKVLFGADIKFALNLFQEQWAGWKDMYVIHLLIQHQYILKNLSSRATFPIQFDEYNIANYDVTFREMAYDVYDKANIKWPKRRPQRSEFKLLKHERFNQ